MNKKICIERTAITLAECKDILKLIGDYWVLMITTELLEDSLRFSELQRRLNGINPITLSNRLKKMEKAASPRELCSITIAFSLRH